MKNQNYNTNDSNVMMLIKRLMKVISNLEALIFENRFMNLIFNNSNNNFILKTFRLSLVHHSQITSAL